MVAPGREVLRQAGEEAAAVVVDVRRLAVHELVRRADLAAEDVTIAWWPRQTPSNGTRPANARTISSETPASSGRPGPGETTRCVGSSRSASSTVISSLRRTTTSAPSSPNRCARLYVNES